MIGADLRSRLEAELGARVTDTAPVSGGDINAASRLDLADGRRVFVKHPRGRAPTGMYAAEAEGLRWLAAVPGVSTPRVVAQLDDALALEWIEAGAGGRASDEAMGRMLARLHTPVENRCGHQWDGWIGSLPQANDEAESWPEFYRARRLEPMVERAGDRFDAADRRAFGRLYARLDDLCGPGEGPRRLHGDLWGGNAMVDGEGRAWLIDPAVYSGDREVDLAMMQLFGGFSDRVFAAYDEELPRRAGHRDRVPLYQLYPLLVHVNLFGGGYVESVRRALSRYVGG